MLRRYGSMCLLVVLGWGLVLGVAAQGCRRASVAPAPGERIVDNRDAGCRVVSGGWGTADTSDGNGCWGADFLYLAADRENVGRVRFAPGVPIKAEYDVSIYWSAASNRTKAQPVTVCDANGKTTTYHIDLQRHGHQWRRLGRHIMGPESYVEFTNDTDAGYCNADAVRLVRP